MRIILEHSPDVTLRDGSGRTVLHQACRTGHLEIVNLLLAVGEIEKLADARSCGGTTPLLEAVQAGEPRVVATCLNSPMNPFHQDRLGKSAADYSTQFPRAILP